MRWAMGVIGVLGIISALYPWIGPGLLGQQVTGGEVGAGWPMFIMGTVYLVASIDPVSWKLLAGASLLGLLTIVSSGVIRDSGGLVFDGWYLTTGTILATLTVLASLVVVWRVRTVEE